MANKYNLKIFNVFYHFLRDIGASVIHRLRNIVLPGFDRLTLYGVLKFFIKGLFEGKLTMRASAISYDFFLALFPTIIFFFTIIPFVPFQDFQPTLLQMLEDVIPKSLYSYVSATLEDIITRQRSDLLSIGFILALYFATNGVNSLIEGFNQTYHVMESRPWYKQRIISIFLVVVISFMVIIAISLFIVGGYVLDFLDRKEILTDSFTLILLQFARWLMVVLLFLFSTSFLYYFAPAKRREFRFISAGSTLATLLLILTTSIFNFYIENFSQYNALYGSIGTLLAFLLWVYFNSIIMLIGFELNASISSAAKDEKCKKPAMEAVADKSTKT